MSKNVSLKANKAHKSIKNKSVIVITLMAHRLLLPLMLGGDDVVGFVRGLGTRRADAGVICAAVNLEQTFVFLADLVLQMECRFDQTMRDQRLHLQGGAHAIDLKKTNKQTNS